MNPKTSKNKKITLNQTHSEGSVKGTAIGTVRDLVAGVAGGLSGAAVGGPVSLALGLGCLGLGHYQGWEVLKPFGIGMMVSTGYNRSKTGEQNVHGVQGKFNIKSEFQNGKTRVGNYLDGLKGKLDLSQFIPPKTTAAPANLGSVDQAFAQLDQITQDLISAGSPQMNQLNEEFTHLGTETATVDMSSF